MSFHSRPVYSWTVTCNECCEATYDAGIGEKPIRLADWVFVRHNYMSGGVSQSYVKCLCPGCKDEAVTHVGPEHAGDRVMAALKRLEEKGLMGSFLTYLMADDEDDE